MLLLKESNWSTYFNCISMSVYLWDACDGVEVEGVVQDQKQSGKGRGRQEHQRVRVTTVDLYLQQQTSKQHTYHKTVVVDNLAERRFHRVVVNLV